MLLAGIKEGLLFSSILPASSRNEATAIALMARLEEAHFAFVPLDAFFLSPSASTGEVVLYLDVSKIYPFYKVFCDGRTYLGPVNSIYIGGYYGLDGVSDTVSNLGLRYNLNRRPVSEVLPKFALDRLTKAAREDVGLCKLVLYNTKGDHSIVDVMQHTDKPDLRRMMIWLREENASS